MFEYVWAFIFYDKQFFGLIIMC